MSDRPGSPPRSLDDVLRLPRVHFVDRAVLPHEPGIYFCLYEATAVRLAYLGKAEDLCARWVGHHREPELRMLHELGMPVEIAWFSARKEQLAELEASLIRTFTPPLNDRPTLRTQRSRLSSAAKPTMATPAEVLQDYRERRDAALDEIKSDEFWAMCNDDDGDLLCVWPYPGEVVLANVNELWMYSDTHSLTAFRVPCPPAISANTGGVVAPEPGFEATTIERRDWLISVARQVDSWLAAVAHFHASELGPTAVRDVMVAVGKEESLVQSLERTSVS